ncbi:hypothetical protein Tco_0383770, partial [Tanacetum coccineum]
DSFVTRLTGIINKAASVGLAYEDSTLVRITKQEWKEIPFSFKLTVSNIEQQGVGSKNLDGGVTESMSRPGIKEDIYAARTPIGRQSVGSITNQKHDQSGFMIDHNFEQYSDLDTMSLDEAIERLKTFEERLKYKNERPVC